MPTYVYRREDGTTFEVQQRITEEPLDTCPETGQPVKRLITGSAGLIFKGDGFYVNDYKSSSNGASPTTNGADAKTDTASNSTDSPSDTSSTASSDTASSDASSSQAV